MNLHSTMQYLSRDYRLATAIIVCLLPCRTLVTPSEKKEKTIAGHKVLRVFKNRLADRPWDASLPGVIFEEVAGRYWFGDRLGRRIYRFEEASARWELLQEFAPVFRSGIQTICRAPDGNIWILGMMSADRDSLRYFDGKGWHEAADQSSLNGRGGSTVILTGRNRNLWIKFSNGLLSFDGSKWREEPSPPKAAEDAYALLCQPRKRYGFGCDMHVVHCAIEDHSEKIWFGLDHSLLAFDEGSSRWIVCPIPERISGIYRIYEDRNRRLWVADDNGNVAVLDEERKRWRVYGFFGTAFHPSLAYTSLVHTNAIYQDRFGEMMFATSAGLITFMEVEGKWSVYVPENSALPSEIVLAIFEDSRGRVFVPTAEGIVILE